MAAPTFQDVGPVVASTGALTVPWPTHAVDDVALLFVESANQAVTLTTANGFAAVTNQGTGTAGNAAATALYVFWCRATSTSQVAPVVADSGARQTAFIMTFRGCIASGNPWDVLAGSVAAAASASVSIPTVTTTVVDALVVNALSNNLSPSATTVQLSTLANANLTNLTKRKNTQSDGTGGTGPTSSSLPVGLMAFGSGGDFGDVGEGPGDMVAADPRCTACHFVPNINTIGAQIDTADQFGILLVLNIAGNKSSYTTTVNGKPTLDMAKYEANLRKFRPDSDNTAFADRLKFADAIRRRRIIVYVVDEPYLTNSFNPNLPDITPTATNQMGLLTKSIWAGYEPITCIRAGAERLAQGWLGTVGAPPGGYTGIDYCWIQYEQKHGRGNPASQPWSTPVNPATLLSDQRQIIADNNFDMGVIPSLNLWAGGIGLDFLGVSGDWDTDGPEGSSQLGWVIAIQRPGEGTATTTLPDSIAFVASNPDWIKKYFDLMAADADIPCAFMWQHATATNQASSFLSYYQRPDYIAAMDYAITVGANRSSFSGWRDAK